MSSVHALFGAKQTLLRKFPLTWTNWIPFDNRDDMSLTSPLSPRVREGNTPNFEGECSIQIGEDEVRKGKMPR
jgi:hypothetical protein